MLVSQCCWVVETKSSGVMMLRNAAPHHLQTQNLNQGGWEVTTWRGQ